MRINIFAEADKIKGKYLTFTELNKALIKAQIRPEEPNDYELSNYKGYDEWQDLGFQVTRGQKSFIIFDVNNGNNMRVKSLKGLKRKFVFNINQTKKIETKPEETQKVTKKPEPEETKKVRKANEPKKWLF